MGDQVGQAGKTGVDQPALHLGHGGLANVELFGQVLLGNPQLLPELFETFIPRVFLSVVRKKIIVIVGETVPMKEKMVSIGEEIIPIQYGTKKLLPGAKKSLAGGADM